MKLKISSFFLQLRAYNQAVLSAGLLLIVGGVFAVLIVDTTNWWNLALVILGTLVLGLFLAANLAEVKAVGKRKSTLVQANLALVAVAMLGIVGGSTMLFPAIPSGST